MKKAIILDVDGVIVGRKQGYNTPNASEKVLAYLKKIRESGVPVVYCTAKPYFAMKYEIDTACLDNPHVLDGGTMLIGNGGVVYKQYTMDRVLAKEIVEMCIKNDLFIVVNTIDNWCIPKNMYNAEAKQREEFLNCKPLLIDDLADFCLNNDVTKMHFTVENESLIPEGKKLLEPFADKINTIWTHNMHMLPKKFAVITQKGVSKQTGFADVTKILGIPYENWLGIGDTEPDWKFMSLCGYAGAMGNSTEKLMELTKTKENHIIGGDVDEEGIIEIIDWYMGK